MSIVFAYGYVWVNGYTVHPKKFMIVTHFHNFLFSFIYFYFLNQHHVKTQNFFNKISTTKNNWIVFYYSVRLSKWFSHSFRQLRKQNQFFFLFSKSFSKLDNCFCCEQSLHANLLKFVSFQMKNQINWWNFGELVRFRFSEFHFAIYLKWNIKWNIKWNSCESDHFD